MLEIGLLDTSSAAFAAMPERVRAALSAKASALAADLQAKFSKSLPATCSI